MALTADDFRRGMRHLAGHVCLVTSVSPEGDRAGLTATAVCSVSVEPPLLLCCINRQAASHAAIAHAGFFAVSVLGFDDRALADRFSGVVSGPERFAMGGWSTLETGAPVLDSALAVFDCRITDSVEAGSHTIIVGRIDAMRVAPQMGQPLLYSHGTYGSFTPLVAASLPEAEWGSPASTRDTRDGR